jgi:Fe-S cluster assembly iron-binding protein IscA
MQCITIIVFTDSTVKVKLVVQAYEAMNITRKALQHIQQLRRRRGKPERVGVRLGIHDGSVCLKWDSARPQEDDFMMEKRGLPLIIDAQTYLRLADYELDFKNDGGRPRFLLRTRSSLGSK